MTSEDVLAIFKEAGALLEGHFILSSGRRSPVFLQKALVFSRPDLSEIEVAGQRRDDLVGGLVADAVLGENASQAVAWTNLAVDDRARLLFFGLVGLFDHRRG